ncbi:sigma 54-interacting transcriptional regulator [Enterococcus pallens]|uniref:Sigma-54 factor interaction domain-containing protein n=1 Tax=Enterococcus pallens ATCC BAA-351 TaxID=1158607 RepID=R2QLP4_9ENTE|nr:sigma 54-interacting transcriptional regulator [Enterococcus pallens]EOH97472.1 hypothetical protein UAU_00140 [Enterococcus pallens ATCC BAA-351]EOU21109.1 hypothetical protein I588_01956 [Enterococcus pallens ATCC BAA-351]OJG80686.1 hypothetical protein RV10_GL004423 [Enterococcus pallens]
MEIILFSGQERFTAKAEKILEDRNLKERCLVVETAGRKTQQVADFYSENGAKVFIARGQNFDLINKKYNIPAVSVRATYEEILVAYQQAQMISNRIAILGYGSIYTMIQRFQRISQEEFLAIKIDDVKNVSHLMKEAAAKGYDTFVGGITTREACSELGLNHVMLDSDSLSIKIALDQALSLIDIQSERSQNFTLIQTILNTSEDAIIAFDEKLKITFINDKAKRIFKSELNQSVTEKLFPAEIKTKIYDNQESLQNYLIQINEEPHLLSIKPLITNQKVYGAVATITISTELINSETTLRKQLAEKGHIAKSNFKDVIGKSSVIAKTITWAKRIAKSENNILIHGDTGTGKELFAQSIHNFSSRQYGPFIAINCAALATSILESELFGYEKGSFTGASNQGKMGVFELAHKGTLFLDEIGEISGELQAKLLRVIQEKEIVRVGGNNVIPVDVRIITATNKDLKKLSRKNEFRSDLFYRLSVLELELPPLKERKEDIPLLVSNYLKINYPTIEIEEASLDYFKKFPFEGNIRQLINLVERCAVLADYSKISQYIVEKVCKKEFEAVNEDTSIDIEDAATPLQPITDEARCLEAALKRNFGNRKQTAQELKISTTTLWRKMKKYGIGL